MQLVRKKYLREKIPNVSIKRTSNANLVMSHQTWNLRVNNEESLSKKTFEKYNSKYIYICMKFYIKKQKVVP